MVAVLEQRAGILGPEDCIAAMLGAARAAGAELYFGEPVLHWTAAADGITLRTEARTVRARRLILAAGAWMAGDLPRLRLPLQVARQTMFWLRPTGTRVGYAPADFPIWLWETPDGRAFYGFPDLGDGPKVARHHGGRLTSPDTVDRAVETVEGQELLAFLREAIPSLAGTVTDAKVCLYTNTPDEHFIIDRHPAHPAILLASPCSGHGFKFAPAVGEILADMAQDRAPRYDLSPFRLGRFPLP
jgi:sarcosine oxidase